MLPLKANGHIIFSKLIRVVVDQVFIQNFRLMDKKIFKELYTLLEIYTALAIKDEHDLSGGDPLDILCFLVGMCLHFEY